MEKSLKILSKLKRVKKLEKIKNNYFVLDIETWGMEPFKENYAFCCLYGNNLRKIFMTIKELEDYLFSGEFKNKFIFAHNATFDYTGIFGNIKKDMDREAVFNGSTFICARKEGVYFYDSLNIYKTSVEQLGKIVGLEKGLTPDKFINGNRSEGITHKDIEYCFKDCKIVWLALWSIFEVVESIRPTIASLALIYFRRFFQKHDLAYNSIIGEKFFNGYFGGRVECFKIGKTYSYKYDINSMYPYIMTKALFPNPKFLKVCKYPSIDILLLYMKIYEGQAEIEVIHKKTNFGYLPLKRNNKLIFPNGKFRGTWCFPEIRYALEQGIIEIKKVHEIVYSYPQQSIFKEYSIELYNKRLDADGINKMVLKSLLNNLYGKFAQRQKNTEIYFDDIPIDICFELKEKGINYEIKRFNKERNDCYLIIFDGKTKNKIHTIPVYSSYITSLARVYLLQNMLKYEKNKVTYVDTDCICVEKPLKVEDSLKLGLFKKEHEIITEISGNKFYKQLEEGIEREKIKGIPRKAIKIENNTYEYSRLIKTKQALRYNIKSGTNEKIIKRVSKKYDKRRIRNSGKTLPLHLDETTE